MTTDLTTLERGLLADIDKAASLDAIEQVRIAAFGKKGCISELMQTLGKLPPEERKAFGQSVNALKARVS
jgi:phenylalanyl-tRNA synthetase alpha chain